MSFLVLIYAQLSSFEFFVVVYIEGRSQWPCGLRRGSAAARLLGLWVRIPPRAWMPVVSVVCCQVEVCAWGWSLAQRSPTVCGVSKQCYRESSKNEEALAH
jgi:hypothetical protein